MLPGLVGYLGSFLGGRGQQKLDETVEIFRLCVGTGYQSAVGIQRQSMLLLGVGYSTGDAPQLGCCLGVSCRGLARLDVRSFQPGQSLFGLVVL